MSDLFTRSRTVILRTWREVEPKLAVGLLTGSLTGFALDFAAQNHVTISPTWQHFIVVGGFFLGGYVKSSSFPTIEQIEADLPKAEAVAQKVIHPPKVSDTTSPVKIVPAAAQVTTPEPASFTQVLQPEPSTDEKPTEVLQPQYSRGASILDQLPSANGGK